MPCLTPIILQADRKFGTDYATQIFPCGKCPECVQRRVTGWTFRLLQEQKVSDTSCFVTFTYRDDQLPFTENGYHSLDKKDFQNFMKRLRKQISGYTKTKYKIKYYAVGEYGTNTNRPHYHAILYNLPNHYINNPLALEAVWNHGAIHMDICAAGSIAYCAGYVNKRPAIDQDIEGDDRVKEFSLMSKGMGASYMAPATVKYHKQHLNPFIVKEGGEKQAMPRYYKDKMFTEKERKTLAKKAIEFMEKIDMFDNCQHEVDYKKLQFYKAKKKARDQRLKI